MSKIEINLVCPNCKTFLKSNDGQKESNVSNKEVVVCPACGSKYYDEDNNIKRCQDCYTIF